MTVWLIGVVLSFNMLTTPIQSHWQSKQFKTELDCLRYLVNQYEVIEENASKYFGEYEINKRTYRLKNLKLRCVSLNQV